MTKHRKPRTMTTVEHNLIDTFALFDLGAIKSIDKENTRTIKNWPGLWPHPLLFLIISGQ